MYSAVWIRPTAKGGAGRFVVGWGRDVMWLVTHGAGIEPSVVCYGVLLQDARNFRTAAIRHRLMLQAHGAHVQLPCGLRDAADPYKR